MVQVDTEIADLDDIRECSFLLDVRLEVDLEVFTELEILALITQVNQIL